MAELPLVKVHGGGRLAVNLAGPIIDDDRDWWVFYLEDGLWMRDYLTDGEVSGPGWRDAVIVPLVEPTCFFGHSPHWLAAHRYVNPGEGSPDELCRLAAAYASAAVWAVREGISDG